MTQSLSHIAIYLPSTGKTSQDAPTSCDSQLSRYAPCSRCLIVLLKRPTSNGSLSSFVHLLDDDSTLIIFSFCRPVLLDESESDDTRILGGGRWNRERWWHRLIQVCRRWRYLVLESAFHLQVSLVCGRGTPVVDMLAHSPPSIPLIIDHFDDDQQELTAEDEKGIIFALQHRDRVRRIRVIKPIPILQKLIIALDGEFPILEFLLIWHQRYYRPVTTPITNFNLPDTFRAPHLHRLLLDNFANPIDSPQFTTMRNLVTLYLTKIPSSTYYHPNVLLQRLSLMPHLEVLSAGFNFSRDVERQLLRAPIMARVTLPKLRQLGFQGSSAYLEVLLPWVTAPLLKNLRICLFNRMVYSIPHLRQFMSTARNIQIKTATLYFNEDHLRVVAYPYMGARLFNLHMELGGRPLDWQIVSAGQVFHALSSVFSVVEDLTLSYHRHYMTSEWNIEADRIHWREVLGSFEKVKSLSVADELVEQLSGALQVGEEESQIELLPELQELSYSARLGGASRNAFTQFIEARQKAGRPVTVDNS